MEGNPVGILRKLFGKVDPPQDEDALPAEAQSAGSAEDVVAVEGGEQVAAVVEGGLRGVHAVLPPEQPVGVVGVGRRVVEDAPPVRGPLRVRRVFALGSPVSEGCGQGPPGGQRFAGLQ